MIVALALLACEAGGPSTMAAGELSLEAGPPSPCEAPLPSVSYTEVGGTWGLRGDPDVDAEHLGGGFAAVFDADADGDLDVLLNLTAGEPRVQVGPVLFRREGQGFVEEPIEGLVEALQLSLSDLDGDGDLDVALGGSQRFLAAEEGTLVPRDLVGMPAERAGFVKELEAADLDQDGLVDLYALTAGASLAGDVGGDFLLRGVAPGEWSLELLPDPDTARREGFDALWLDADGDDDMDLYVVNDRGDQVGPNVLYRNDGGALVDASEECACGLALSGMAVDAADWNGDALPDLYLAATWDNVLLASETDGTWVDVTQATGADPLAPADEIFSPMSWSAIWLDHDNDGRLDLLSAQGDLWYADDGEGLRRDQPLDLLRWDGEAFVDVAIDLGLDQAGSFRAAVAADHNDDGVLDLLVTEVIERPQLYLSDGCTAAGWLAVEGPVGARVEVVAGGQRQVRWIQTASGYAGAGPARAHVGLGAHQQVDAVRVTLPDGRFAAQVGPMPARRVLRVVDPDREATR